MVSLKEIANICFLSETRFLHLFKEKTNLNFRRYQLWNKLIKSLPYLKEHSITDTAYQFGFTDSSHYSRTFKETFGLTPKFLSSLK
ncbi:helix-turn-helix domain-containing protein [Sphingobacterium sp. 2149]|uniref:helix-turn-helix domain-containing protein n=1 Tax=Sphingobacterium sp. 2149 TaxID=2817763 RepID=UPI0038F791EB